MPPSQNNAIPVPAAHAGEPQPALPGAHPSGAGYTEMPYLLEHRLPMVDVLELARRKHNIHLAVDADVTLPRRRLKEYRAAGGEGLSFTAFITACTAKAVDENKIVHAYRKGRRKLVLFDDVDANVIVEREVDGQMVLFPCLVRAANRKSAVEIHGEIRRAQEEARQKKGSRHLEGYPRLMTLMPGFVRLLGVKMMLNSPELMKKWNGTIAVSAMGAAGKGISYVTPVTAHTLSVALGGIQPVPALVDGGIESREHLPLVVTVDHDIIDGAPAARFATRLKELIESGYGLPAAG